MGADLECVFWSFAGLGVVLCVSKWVAIAWSKLSFAWCVFVISWDGFNIQVGWLQISCVLCVAPA